MQVSGLTRLMMETSRDSSNPGGSRRENRRETWAPGAAGGVHFISLSARLQHVIFHAIVADQALPSGEESLSSVAQNARCILKK